MVTANYVTKMAVTPFDAAVAENSVMHANFIALCFIEPELMAIHTVEIRFSTFCSCDLDLDPFSLEMYRVCENELPTSRLSKVII